MKYCRGSLRIIALIMIIAVLGIGGGFLYYKEKIKVSNFEECVKSRFAVLETTYPVQCVSPWGKFVRLEDKKNINKSNTNLIESEYININNNIDENAEKHLLKKNKDFARRVVNNDENYLILKTDTLTDIILRNINPIDIEKCEPKCDFKKYTFYGYYSELNIYVIHVKQPDATDFIYFDKKTGNQIKASDDYNFFYGIPIFSPLKTKFLNIGNSPFGVSGFSVYEINQDKTFYKIFDSNEKNITINDSYEKVRWLNENEIELKKMDEIKWTDDIKYVIELPSEVIKIK